jgi:hypothetical protein
MKKPKQFPEQELIFLSKEQESFERILLRKNVNKTFLFDSQMKNEEAKQFPEQELIILSKEQESFERILLLQILSKKCKQNLSL